MKPETQRKIWEFLLYFLLLLACILLIINFILFRSDSGECVRQPKEFLLEHFEKLTGGNITCTCLSDAPRDYTANERKGYKIIFSSFDDDESPDFSGDLYDNLSIRP